jgi:hypothetical protein
MGSHADDKLPACEFCLEISVCWAYSNFNK